MNLPLDMMTITIAAITVGMQLTIAFIIYRFREEYYSHQDYLKTVSVCHSVLVKQYFTGITVIFGFSILILSNFIPTIIFVL